MQKHFDIHRRAKTVLQLLPTRDANNVKKSFGLIEENSDNLSNLRGKVFKFVGSLKNTYMIKATLSLRVIFEIMDDGHILIQDIVHRNLVGN
jgi:mRNA-degrading endonuclease RelE of RelBE toxin-antitoxin system